MLKIFHPLNRSYKLFNILNILIFFYYYNLFFQDQLKQFKLEIVCLFFQDQLKQVKLEIANKIDFGNKWVFFDTRLL